MRDYFMNKQVEKIIRKADWTSPSNIAFIKYWGKYGNQLPSNPSLSMSLKNSTTRTIVLVIESRDKPAFQFFFEGFKESTFDKKIDLFLKNAYNFFPSLQNKSLKIESCNTFPHSAGIASSASAMSSLALCICEIAEEKSSNYLNDAEFYRKASELARLGSGSASRSVYGGFSTWGKTSLLENSSDEWATFLDFDIHPVFSKLNDAILIVSSEPKKISSSEGHQLMNNHPYAKERFKLAHKNLECLLKAFQSGDTEEFIRVIENEALGLHSLMMSSDPAFILVKPHTLEIINRIIDFRKKTGLFLCFTLDAGPNVHLIYPDSIKSKITDLINSELLAFCENRKVIWDEIGEGPVRFTSENVKI